MKKELIERTVYQCPYCDDESLVYDTKEHAEEHVKECIFNPENESYATSRFLGVELYPPYPRYAKNDRPYQVQKLLNGVFHRAYDTRTGEYIKDEEFYKPAPGWEEAELAFDGEKRYYKRPELRFSEEMKESKYYEQFKELADELKEEYPELRLRDEGEVS